MKFKSSLIFLPIFIIVSCSLPGIAHTIEDHSEATMQEEQTVPQAQSQSANEPQTTQPAAATDPPSGQALMPADLEYLGAFRLPDASGGSEWIYSGQGLAVNPDGDPQGPEDGFPGSLFGVGQDQQVEVSEIYIPVPVIADNLADLHTAQTLQPFADISGGLMGENLELPVVGLEIMDGNLYFCYGQHFQDFEPSHGVSSLDLSHPNPQGPWMLEGISNYTSNDYLFSIPEDWAAAYTPGQTLATGRFREGVWSGSGPALYAMDPHATGNIRVTTLLLYGIQQPGDSVLYTDETMQMDGYQESDHWSGGAWLTAGDRSAVVFAGTKATGRSWYGFANGVEWAYDCADTTPITCPEVPEYPYDNRGYWAEAYQAQIIFYNPADLAAVAQGSMDTWAPQPYAVLDLTHVLFDPQIDVTRYKRDLVGAMAFDRQHNLLYLFERLADEDKSIVHVWRVGS